MNIGMTIRTGREKHNMTRVQLAKKLKISAQYLGHLENGSPMSISPRLVEGFDKTLRVKLSREAVVRLNQVARAYAKKLRENKKKPKYIAMATEAVNAHAAAIIEKVNNPTITQEIDFIISALSTSLTKMSELRSRIG